METKENQQSPGLVNSPVSTEGAPPNLRARFRWWAGGAVVVAALVGGIIFEAHLRAAATPKITWSQPSVLEFLQPNQTRTITLTLTSDQSISNAGIFVAPALASVLSASPATFGKISPNQPYQVLLVLTAAAQSEVKFDGTIQVKSGGPSTATYAQPLPTTVVVHNQYVPPDPGPANNETIAGIDSDGDGVRDDIDRYAVLTYLASPITGAAVLQFARTAQSFLTSPSIATVEANMRSIVCLFGIDSRNARGTTNDLRSRLLNTSGRLRAWDTANKVVSGHILDPGDLGNRMGQCTFDTSSFSK
jgi:hypothetical protein